LNVLEGLVQEYAASLACRDFAPVQVCVCVDIPSWTCVSACVGVCMYVPIYLYMYKYIHMNIYISSYKYIYIIYIYTYVSMSQNIDLLKCILCMNIYICMYV